MELFKITKFFAYTCTVSHLKDPFASPVPVHPTQISMCSMIYSYCTGKWGNTRTTKIISLTPMCSWRTAMAECSSSSCWLITKVSAACACASAASSLRMRFSAWASSETAVSTASRSRSESRQVKRQGARNCRLIVSAAAVVRSAGAAWAAACPIHFSTIARLRTWNCRQNKPPVFRIQIRIQSLFYTGIVPPYSEYGSRFLKNHFFFFINQLV